MCIVLLLNVDMLKKLNKNQCKIKRIIQQSNNILCNVKGNVKKVCEKFISWNSKNKKTFQYMQNIFSLLIILLLIVLFFKKASLSVRY
jgi:hypothetical protein